MSLSLSSPSYSWFSSSSSQFFIIKSVGWNRGITCTRRDRPKAERSPTNVQPHDLSSRSPWYFEWDETDDSSEQGTDAIFKTSWRAWARQQICLWSSPSLFTDGVTAQRGCYSCPNLAQLLLIQCLVRCWGINVLDFTRSNPSPPITRHKILRFTAISPYLFAVKTNRRRRRLFIAGSIMEECIGMKWSSLAGSSGGKSWNILSTETTPKGVVTTQWWKF